MNLDLLLLIAVMTATIVIWSRLNVWRRPRSGNKYQRVFTSAAAGLLFFITGLLGWPMGRDDGAAHGPDNPIWWQVLLGAVLLLLATWWAKQVSPQRSRHSDSHSRF